METRDQTVLVISNSITSNSETEKIVEAMSWRVRIPDVSLIEPRTVWILRVVFLGNET